MAKVISYEDFQEARVKRAEKDATKEAKGKGKRGRKRKSAMPEAGEAEADEATADKGKRGRKRKSATLEADEPELEPEVARLMYTLVPWRAPVVRMI
jgi:hypothetical protein